MTAPPRILAIAGSDSSGGAGIQADIKTITMLGGYAMTAITTLTAQNTLGVTRVDSVDPEMVAAQIDACVSDIGVDAVKIGMLGSAAVAEIVAERLEALAVPIVFDPVMVATSGATLADAATVAVFERLMKLATVVTPNTDELAALAGVEIANVIEQISAAHELMDRSGCKAILAKGGHLVLTGETHSFQPDGRHFSFANSTRVFDYLCVPGGDSSDQKVWYSERVDTRHTHGTGCTLASAIATFLGMEMMLPEAVEKARDFVRAALLAAPGFGAGSGPMGHQAVRPQQSSS